MDELLERGLEFSLHVHKPDGVVPSLSDGDARELARTAGARAPSCSTVTTCAGWPAPARSGQAPKGTLALFADSGYSVVRSSWGQGPADFADAQYLVLDCGPLGEGNHGHLDCLSFELAAFGRSLVVDPGRFTYSEAGDVNWRVHFRGTAAHNTVCVDGRHQTRYAPKAIKEPSRHAQGSVRHKIGGPGPDATLIEAATAPGLVLLHGRAGSYEYDAVHERVIAFLGGCLWLVSDTLGAEQAHQYALHFQLGAQAQGQTSLQTERGVQLHSPGLSLYQPAVPGLQAELVDGWVSARYGHKQAAPGLRCVQQAANAHFDSLLVPWRHQAPSVHLKTVPVYGAATPLQALQIEHDSHGARQVDTWFHHRSAGDHRWRWGDLSFDGRWLHLRHSADGQLCRATSHRGATLLRAGRRVPLAVCQQEVLR
jgi:hypothetical protein